MITFLLIRTSIITKALRRITELFFDYFYVPEFLYDPMC